jgi:hypothetical protein
VYVGPTRGFANHLHTSAALKPNWKSPLAAMAKLFMAAMAGPFMAVQSSIR